MKQLITILLIAVTEFGLSQDTLSFVKYNNGVSTYILIEDEDTVMHTYYQNGNIESIRSLSISGGKQNYQRFYPNGKRMWNITLKNMKPDGEAVYYDESGKRIAVFDWSDGVIQDTLFLDRKVNFILGRSTYYSVVYGGMERVDGGSNIDGGDGVHIYQDFYTVRQNSNLEQQEVYNEFLTDFNGYFMVCVKKGSYGIFPKWYSIDKVKASHGAPPPAGGGGYSSSWNLSKPLDLSSQNFQYINLHFHSVGYAP